MVRKYWVLELIVYVAGCEGDTITREFPAAPSCHPPRTYCVPTASLCGDGKATVQLDCGVQFSVCGARYAPGEQPVPATVNPRPAGADAIVTGMV